MQDNNPVIPPSGQEPFVQTPPVLPQPAFQQPVFEQAPVLPPVNEKKSLLVKIALALLLLSVLGIGGYFGYTLLKPKESQPVLNTVETQTDTLKDSTLDEIEPSSISPEIPAEATPIEQAY